MSLRLTAPSEDILGANYKITKIVASDYNPNIDSTITVTVTVKDVYDDPVENESVQVTCNIGKFTKLNGSTISDTQSVTGTTNSSGQFTLTYTCSEWGLATFSANTVNTQVKVKGWRIHSNTSSYTIIYNENNVYVSVGLTTYNVAGTVYDIVTLPANLRPLGSSTVPSYSIGSSGIPIANLKVGTDGRVQLVLQVNTSNIKVYASITLPR